MKPSRAIALTIAGSDSSGGAGIQADIKTFSAFGVYGASVITALTAQNTMGVAGILSTPPDFITAQLDAVASDLAIAAVKTGMLGTRAAVEAVADGLTRHKLSRVIVDPVMIASSGDVLIDDDAIDALRLRLIPLAVLITPNLPEAARLLDTSAARDIAEMEAQARALQTRFMARNVLLKGGHGTGNHAVDLLLTGGKAIFHSRPRLDVTNTHGTGCTLSAAIAALLALDVSLNEAVARAKAFVWNALEAGCTHGVGHGRGPLDHLYHVRRDDPPA